MDDKLIIGDTLCNCNTYINMLNYAILQSNNKNLRDYFIGVRNEMETLQWEVYSYSKTAQGYMPSAPAGQADIEAVKKALSGN